MEMSSPAGQATVRLEDAKGTNAVLGHVELEKTAIGSVEQRPASSLVFFDKNSKVIWQAP